MILLPALAPAQERSPAQEVAPYLDDQALGVAYADLTAIDLGPVEKWVVDHLDGAARNKEDFAEPIKDIRHGFAMAAQWLKAIRDAGARHLFVLLSPADIEEPTFIVTTGPNPNPGAIAAALGRGQGLTEKIGDALVIGSADSVAALRALKAAPRPELANALGGDGPVRLAILPTADARHVIETTMPLLPRQVGGGPSTMVTRGIVWGNAWLKLPPEPAIQLTIQSKDAASAEALAGLAGKALGLLADVPELKPLLAGGQILTAMTPQVSGDQLRLSLDAGRIEKTFWPVALRILEHARATAREQMAMNAVRQLLMACMMYASDHKNEWPESLDVLVKQRLVPAELLVHPRHPQHKPGYVYIKPQAAEKAQRVVMYEAYDQWPGQVVAGFADGHVEIVKDEKQLPHP